LELQELGFKHVHISYTNPYSAPDEEDISCGDAGDDGSVDHNNTTVFIMNEAAPSTARPTQVDGSGAHNTNCFMTAVLVSLATIPLYFFLE
jgi:hypothetical protein